MSPRSWPKLLLQTLAQEAKPDSKARLALVGIGNELNGDDAAGVIIARRLKSRLSEQPGVLVLEAGLAPENFTGILRRFDPALVVIIDAAQMGADPGEIRWLAWEAAVGVTAVTHGQPLSTLAQYLINELACRVALLGIQPAHLDPGQSISPPVRSAIRRIVNTFSKIEL